VYDQLFGEVVKKTPTSFVLDVRGVGFFLEASLRSTAALPGGVETRVYVHHRQSEDSVRLFGFVDEAEREIFRALLKVNGVGPAHALALLSTLSPDELWTALRDGSERVLTASKGIGAKIAQRLITELRDEASRRAPRATAGSDAPPSPPDPADDDAIGALVVLGYTEPAAAKAVQAAKKKLAKPVPVEELVRAALNQR
jgi:Holliday junction DNA helicase RuvA